MKEILNDLMDHRTFSRNEAREILLAMASGKFNASQMSSFLTVFMMRTITVAELQGFRDAMLELCHAMSFDQPVMDVCGTGGDGKNTFNISTLASFVVAAAGQPVAKHGNYGVSSACGSSNVLEFLGYEFTNDPDELKRSLDRSNICFMHAPLFHPAMKSMAPIRKELGLKTFFNMLGPMVNPASPKKQMTGVFNLELARQYGYLFQQSNVDFTILHTLDGYDEISLTGPFKCFSNEGEDMLEPADLGLSKTTSSQLSGGESVVDSAEIFMHVLKDNGTRAQREAVIANAGMALYCADRTQGLPVAIQRATEALESGKAFTTFKKFLNA